MAGKWHLGAKVPPLGLVNPNKYLTDPRHNWKIPLIDGPQDIGFDYSMITTGGIQDAPYSFLGTVCLQPTYHQKRITGNVVLTIYR